VELGSGLAREASGRNSRAARTPPGQVLGNSLQVAMPNYIKPSIKDGLAWLASSFTYFRRFEPLSLSAMYDIREPMTMAHAGSCPKCFYVLPPISEAAPTYFEQGYVTCSECKAPADLWDVVLARMNVDPPMPKMSLVCLGAAQTTFQREISADKYHMIDLTEVGVPKDATVLQVGYTPQGTEGQGSVMPIELHGNVPQRRVVGSVLHLLGRAMISGDGTVGTVSRVSIWVLWVPYDKAESWSYIVSGFDAFVAQH